MWLKIIKISALILVISACKEEKNIQNIQFSRIQINNNYEQSAEIEKIIAPYKNIVDDSLNKILCYSKKSYSKSAGNLNTAIGNMMADAVYETTAPIFKNNHNIEIDAVLLNFGGIRSIIPMGKVTIENAYEIMPFENKIIAVKMKYDVISKMVKYLVTEQKAHPISGMKIEISKNGTLNKFFIKGEQINKNRDYYIVTSDYLYKGGDSMNFFKESDSSYTIDYKVRNILIDFFKKSDTINLKSDYRFTYSNLK